MQQAQTFLNQIFFISYWRLGTNVFTPIINHSRIRIKIEIKEEPPALFPSDGLARKPERKCNSSSSSSSGYAGSANQTTLK